MSSLTLTQNNQSAFGSVVPPERINFPMKDSLNNNVESVIADIDDSNGNKITFEAWGPSVAVIDSLNVTGTFPGQQHVHMTFHGTGNITGHGNDDVYSGSIDYDMNFSFREQPPGYQCFGKNGTATVTYTD